jgi:hypothetical protein
MGENLLISDAYTPQAELGLITKWIKGKEISSNDDVDDNSAYKNMKPDEKRMRAMGTLITATASSYYEEMVLPSADEARKQSIMASPDDFMQETPAGLRLTALENMYKKLDARGQGYLEDLYLDETAVFVRYNFEEPEEPIELTQYERGLLSYAMPNIQQAITLTGRITHERMIYILRTILFAADPRDDAKGRLEKVAQSQQAKTGDQPKAKQNDGMKQSANEGSNIRFAMQDSDDEVATSFDRRKSVEGSSNLMGLITRLYKKLDPDGKGYLDDVPEITQDMTAFETALMDLVRNRLQYEFHKADEEGDGRVGKQIVMNMLCEALEQDLAGEKGPRRPVKEGLNRPPLETELRSIHREAARLRKGQRAAGGGDGTELCTFKPEILKRADRPSQNARAPRASATSRLGATMSSKDIKEMIELQECTFQPNLHKCVAPKFEDPKYRLYRTSGDLQRIKAEREWRRHWRQDGGYSRWAENLRGFSDRTALDDSTNKSCYARRDVSPGKYARKADMDVSILTTRRDAKARTDAGELDWGSSIRLASQRFSEHDRGEELEEQENTRVFAETFLALRATQARGRDLIF